MAKTTQVVDGAEASVETGIGCLTKVDEPKGRNAKIELNAEHLSTPVSGWVDTNNVDLYDFARTACAEGWRVEYRIVVKRKGDVDVDVPFADLDRTQKVRDVARLSRAGGVVGGAAASTPASAPPVAPPASDTAPSTNGAPTAQAPPAGLLCGLCNQSIAGSGRVRTVNGVRQHVECPPDADGPPPGPLPTDGPSRAAGNGAGPRIAEGKPWDFYNSDGSLNPGSYAYTAAEGMVLLANDLLLARARALVDDGHEFRAPTEGQLRGLARRLLRAADRAQAGLRDDGHVARMANSHSRCRAALRAALEVFPVPWLATKDQLDGWEVQLADHAGVLLRLTAELIDPEPLP